jgi:phosphoglycerol transferase MdoB-like AlkP superfamily enzyme
MKRKFLSHFIKLCSILALSYVDVAYATNIQQAVNNILGPLSAFTDAFYKICYVLGILLIAGAGVQYAQFRRNPVQVKFSNVMFLLIIGIVVVCLPFIVQLSSSAKTIDNALVRQGRQAIVPQQTPIPTQPKRANDGNDNWYDNP